MFHKYDTQENMNPESTISSFYTLMRIIMLFNMVFDLSAIIITHIFKPILFLFTA